jgi:hypothetical protein
MKTVRVNDAVGMVLAHDLTQIIPDCCKGSRFKKGHVIREADIPVLLDMGKENLFVLELAPGDVHEDEAAVRIAKAASGRGLVLSTPREGKVELSASRNGLLKVAKELLFELNNTDEVMFATLHNNQVVKKGQIVAGTRVIPLVVSEKVVAQAEKTCQKGALVEILTIPTRKIGIVTTGSEVYSGRIKDAFGPILLKKYAELGSTVVRQIFASDSVEMIVGAIHELLAEGVDMIAVTGGMSVDPDDRTPYSIRQAGGDIVTYGAPVLPGAMFMLAYIGETPVVGLPGCVMYYSTSIFDLIIPRILVGEKLTRSDIKELAHGGLCRNCDVCRFPNCAFGKA